MVVTHHISKTQTLRLTTKAHAERHSRLRKKGIIESRYFDEPLHVGYSLTPKEVGIIIRKNKPCKKIRDWTCEGCQMIVDNKTWKKIRKAKREYLEIQLRG